MVQKTCTIFLESGEYILYLQHLNIYNYSVWRTKYVFDIADEEDKDSLQELAAGSAA